MNSGIRITGQLRQPTTSLHTRPITLQQSMYLFKHHITGHTPDFQNYVY